MQTQKKRPLTRQELEELLNDTKGIYEQKIMCPNCKGLHQGEGQTIIKKYITQQDQEEKQTICKTCFFCEYYI